VDAYPGAVVVPLSSFDPQAIPDPKGKQVVFACRSGKRSVTASLAAQEAGLPTTSIWPAGCWPGRPGLPTSPVADYSDDFHEQGICRSARHDLRGDVAACARQQRDQSRPGFPDDPGPEDIRQAAADAVMNGYNQYPSMMGFRNCARRFPSLRAVAWPRLDPMTEVMVTPAAPRR